MSSFVCYKKLSKAQIKKDTKQSITNIKNWFKENPKRKTCRAQLWYGKVTSVRKDHIKEDINAAADAAIESNK